MNSTVGRRALFYTIAGRILQIAIGLGTFRLLTLYLSKEQVGEYGLFANIAALLVFLTIRPLGQYVNRRLHEWFESGNLPFVLARVIAIQLGLSVVSAPAIVFGASLLNLKSATPLYVWALVWGCWFLAFSVFNTTVPALNLLGLKLQWVATNCVGLGLGLALAWGGVVVAPSAVLWTAGVTAGFLLGAVSATAILLRAGRRQARDRNRLGPIVSLAFLVPATAVIGGDWMQFQSFRLISAQFMPIDTYGLFIAGYGLASGVMSAFEGLAAQYLQPYFYAGLSGAAGAPQSHYWKAYAGTMITLAVATSLVAMGGAPLICKIVLAPAFQAAWPYFLLGALIEGMRAISNAIVLGTHVTLKVTPSLRSYAAGAVVIAVGVAVGHLLDSWLACAAVVVLACLTQLAVIARDVSRHLGVAMPLPLDRHVVVLAVAVAILLAATLAGANWPIQLTLAGVTGLLYLHLLAKLRPTGRETEDQGPELLRAKMKF